MIQKGAHGYVTKNSSGEEMRKAILEIYNNRVYICDEIKNNIVNLKTNENELHSSFYLLSKREIEVITHVKKGFSSKEIAAKLSIGCKTVEAHRYNILKKLNFKNTPGLLNFINTTSLA